MASLVRNALAEIDEFVSADLRHQTAREEDLRVNPAVSDLVREAYAALLLLAEDPASHAVQFTLDNINARFDQAAAIFDQPLLDLEEEQRRLHSRASAERQEFAARLAAAQQDLAEARAERDSLTNQFAAERDSLTNQFAAARDQSAELAAARDRLASELGTERNGRRKMNRRLERDEEIIAYMADRFARLKGASATRRIRGVNGRKSLMRELQAIRNSVYFDEAYYLQENADVRAARLDASLHYLLFGAKEGRDPGPFFSTGFYLAYNPDVAATGVNPLAHYERHGRKEKRNVPDPSS